MPNTFLHSLTVDERAECLERGSLRARAAGEMLVQADAPFSSLSVILSGSADVRRRDGVVLATLGAGDVVGEMSFLNGRPRTADVAAMTDAEVLLITREFLERLTRGAPAVAARLLMNLSMYLVDRLQNTTQGLVSMMEQRAPPAAPVSN